MMCTQITAVVLLSFNTVMQMKRQMYHLDFMSLLCAGISKIYCDVTELCYLLLNSCRLLYSKLTFKNTGLMLSCLCAMHSLKRSRGYVCFGSNSFTKWTLNLSWQRPRSVKTELKPKNHLSF